VKATILFIFKLYQWHMQQISRSIIANLTKGPLGPKLSWDYTSEISKCDTGPALPPDLYSLLYPGS